MNADWCKLGGCRSLFGRGNGVACVGETSGLCGKRILPPLGLDPGSATPKGSPSARDDTVDSLVMFV